MEFALTKEQQAWRDQVREFAKTAIIPYASQIDEEDQFPREIITQLGENGYLGIPIPQEWGGLGADFLSYIIAIEEISYASATLGVILAVHTSVGTMPILKHGSEWQQQRYLNKLATGQLLGAFALTEAHAGSDASRISTRAVRDGDHYILNGSKVFITNGGEADLYITFAVTDPDRGIEGISAFIIEKDTVGFTVGKKEKKMGLNGSATTTLRYDNAIVPSTQLLGKEGEGFKLALGNLSGGRISIASQALGIARAAYDAAKNHVVHQLQLNKNLTRLSETNELLVRMSTKLEAARLLVYRAALLRQQGKPSTMEASMAKMFATDTAMSVTTDALQLQGIEGYLKKSNAERYLRDAKATQIYEGTNQIQRIVIAKHILQ